jgi:PhnB protein
VAGLTGKTRPREVPTAHSTNFYPEEPVRPPVAPYLTVSPALAAITFYTTVFGARQKVFMPSFDAMRVMHCELEINGGSLMLADAFPEFGHTRVPLPGELATVSVSLEFAEASAVDEIFKKATSLGGKGETNPTNSFWGTRVATFRDPFGHRWILNAPLA